jgi:hypothetical protein
MVSSVAILRMVRRRVLRALTVNAAVALIAASLMITPASAAAQSAKPDVYFVPDVVGQFRALSLRPEPFGLWVWGHPDPSNNIDKHYQGIARSQGPGLPHMFLAWNGNDSNCVFCDDEPGQIFVIRMLSRDATGERLRSNRLKQESPIFNVVEGMDAGTHPDLRDCLVARIVFDGTGVWPHYRHPGAMQVVGDVLAVPLSKPADGDPPLRIQFIDITDPAAPAPLSAFDIEPPSNNDFGAGLVALTPVRNPFGPGQRYLMAVAGEDGTELRLYRSLSTDVDHPQNGPSDLKATNLDWEEIDRFSGAELGSFWPCCSSKSHQMLNFVREGTLDGALYLIGAYNPSAVLSPGGGEDFFTLYRVNVDSHGNPASPLLTHVERLHVTTNSIAGDTSHFAGSTGVYVSPSGELILYANEHEEQGPLGRDPLNGHLRRSVRAGEWRHRQMVRPGSPTLKPSVEPVGSFVVDEGGTATLTTTGRPPTTRAWLQLFRDTGLGLSDDNFDKELVFDYDDRDVEDYDDIPKMYSDFNDEASSMRWFAPQGCTVEVDEHSRDDDRFPGGYKILGNDFRVWAQPNLASIHWDNGSDSVNDRISAVRFSCDNYYGAPIAVSWDLNGDGTYETNGTSATFSAASFDGPTIAMVATRAKHPTDTTPLGTGNTLVPVEVRNVAPTIASAAVTDPLGRDLAGGANVAIAGVPVRLAVTFTDPGRADTQTASVAWGDGTIDTAFQTFSDARNGAVGRLGDSYAYAAPGTYDIVATVTDDDEGASAVSFTIEVLSIEQAILQVVETIDALLMTATDPTVRAALLDARDELVGNHGGTPPTNGALDMLDAGDPVSAITKLSSALSFLMTAETSGAGDLSALKNLLGLATEGIATTAYYQATVAIPNPSRGQARALESIAGLIFLGHEQLGNRQYVKACESFRQATDKALNLMP